MSKNKEPTDVAAAEALERAKKKWLEYATHITINIPGFTVKQEISKTKLIAFGKMSADAQGELNESIKKATQALTNQENAKAQLNKFESSFFMSFSDNYLNPIANFIRKIFNYPPQPTYKEFYNRAFQDASTNRVKCDGDVEEKEAYLEKVLLSVKTECSELQRLNKKQEKLDDLREKYVEAKTVFESKNNKNDQTESSETESSHPKLG